MPPPSLIDLSTLDLSCRVASREDIYAVLPHRDEFMLLDRIVFLDSEAGLGAAVKEVRQEDWWARGHIPGRPLLPGVLMIEAAAQLASYYISVHVDDQHFLGFAALDKVKFRGTVTPPANLIIVGKIISLKPRRFVMDGQAFVDRKMVFEARLTGMIV